MAQNLPSIRGTVRETAGILTVSAGWAIDTTTLVLSLPSRIDRLLNDVQALLHKVDAVANSAAMVVTRIEHTADEAENIVGAAQGLTNSATGMVEIFEPMSKRAAPMLQKFVDNFSEAELDAAIKMVDRLPELLDRTEALMPILETMDTVAPEIHELLGVTEDVRRAVIGIPGFKFFRNRGEDKLETDE